MRRFVLVAGVLALAGAAALGALAWVASTRTDLLLAGASRGLGRSIEASGARLAVRGGLGVALQNVRIGDDPRFGSEPFLTARALEMRLRLLPLVRRQLVIDYVLVDAPVVTVLRDRAGRLNVDSLGSPKTARDDPASGDGKGGHVPFQLASLRLRDGLLRYRELANERTLEIAELAMDARQPQFGGTMPVSLRARLAAKDLRMDDIRSEGTLDLSGGVPTFRGTVEAGPGALGQLAVTKVTGRVVARPPTIELEEGTAHLLDGRVVGSARLASAGEGPGLSARLDATGLALDELPAPPGRPRPAGTLAMQGELTGPSPDTPGFRRRLAGGGRFQVADARLSGIPLGRALNDVLTPLLGTDDVARLRSRYPDLFAAGDELRFTRLSGSGRLAGAMIRSDDLVIAAPSYEATGAGTLSLDGDVDVALHLTAGEALTDDIFGRSKARALLVDERGRLTIPVRVHGPLRHPRVTPDPSFVTSVARSLLGRTGLGEAAGSVLEQLLQKRKRKH